MYGCAGAMDVTGGTGTVTKRFGKDPIKNQLHFCNLYVLPVLGQTRTVYHCALLSGGQVCLTRIVLEMQNSSEMYYAFRKQSQSAQLHRYVARVLQDLILLKTFVIIWY